MLVKRVIRFVFHAVAFMEICDDNPRIYSIYANALCRNTNDGVVAVTSREFIEAGYRMIGRCRKLNRSQHFIV